MKCKECGEKVNHGDRYCDFCGAPVYQKKSIYDREYTEVEMEEKDVSAHQEKIKGIFADNILINRKMYAEMERKFFNPDQQNEKKPRKRKFKWTSFIFILILFNIFSKGIEEGFGVDLRIMHIVIWGIVWVIILRGVYKVMMKFISFQMKN